MINNSNESFICKNAKCYIFDLDGTLYDSVSDIALCCNEALREFDLPKHNKEEYIHFIGNGERKLIERAIGSKFLTDQLCDKVQNKYKEIYATGYDKTSDKFDGIMELLEKLKSQNKLICIASNKPDNFVKDISKKHFDDIFDFVVGQKDGYKVKPDNRAVLEMLKELNLKNSDCVFIGDSYVDIETANNCNIKSVFATYGYGKNELALEFNPDFIVDSVAELNMLLCL